MKIVLLKDVDKLGRLGDTKDVANGFAVNWLIPQGLAVFALGRQAKRLVKKRAWLDSKAAAAQVAPQAAAKPTKAEARKRADNKKDSKKVKQLKKEEGDGTRLRAS